MKQGIVVIDDLREQKTMDTVRNPGRSLLPSALAGNSNDAPVAPPAETEPPISV